MDKEQKNIGTVKSDTQHQGATPETTVIDRPMSQECDLKKVLKSEVLDL